MDKNRSIIGFIKEQTEIPGAWILLLVDIASVIGIATLVIDDWREAVIMAIFIFAILFGQYQIYLKFQQKLTKYEQSLPQISFSQVRQAILHKSELVSLDPPEVVQGPEFEVIQAWFVNHPSLPMESTIAKNVTALITISRNGSKVLEYNGQWAESNAPDNVGYDGYQDMIDILPGHISSKLFIALKFLDDADCYAFTREGLIVDSRYPRFRIEQGDYTLIVRLEGIGINNVYRFKFCNPGAGKNMVLEAVNQ